VQEYDIALKVLLKASAASVLWQVSGERVARWLETEMREVQISRADLLGVTADGRLLHVELQSTNDPAMAIRMAEYGLRIYREHKQFPKQIVLYVGEAPLRMKASLTEPDEVQPDLAFRYSLVDIRTLDGAALLSSSRIQDNLLAVLTRLPQRMEAIREILERIANLEAPARREAFAQFLIISGLRKLEPAIRQEAQTMPILNDILDHQVIGPAIREGLQQGLEKGLQQGREQGLQQGRELGLQQGRLEILRRLLEKRFGPLPNAAATRLYALSETELDQLALRILDASTLDELFPY
jgi:predicted transposase YdaD